MKTIQFLVRSSMVLLFAMLVLPPAMAGNSWLDQGSKALKSLNVTTDAKTQTGTSSSGSGLSLDTIISGLKEALKVGSGNVVTQLGATDGFNKDSSIHIPLPDSLATVKKALDAAGMGSLTDDLELKLNRAAEAATPKAKALFMDAITQMTFEDAKAIYEGADDAATQYFKEKMSPGLAEAMAPVVDDTLSQVGAVKAYDNVMGKYKTFPFVPDVKANLSEHVVEKGMDGIFYYMAKEEKAIRQDPVKRTTDLLKTVFGK